MMDSDDSCEIIQNQPKKKVKYNNHQNNGQDFQVNGINEQSNIDSNSKDISLQIIKFAIQNNIQSYPQLLAQLVDDKCPLKKYALDVLQSEFIYKKVLLSINKQVNEEEKNNNNKQIQENANESIKIITSSSQISQDKNKIDLKQEIDTNNYDQQSISSLQNNLNNRFASKQEEILDEESYQLQSLEDSQNCSYNESVSQISKQSKVKEPKRKNQSLKYIICKQRKPSFKKKRTFFAIKLQGKLNLSNYENIKNSLTQLVSNRRKILIGIDDQFLYIYAKKLLSANQISVALDRYISINKTIVYNVQGIMNKEEYNLEPITFNQVTLITDFYKLLQNNIISSFICFSKDLGIESVDELITTLKALDDENDSYQSFVTTNQQLLNSLITKKREK